MNNKLKILFVDNPDLAEQVCAFCDTRPEFRETEERFHALSDQAAGRLGKGFYLEFEEAWSSYLAQLANAYYLFGLGLRQEVISTLEP